MKVKSTPIFEAIMHYAALLWVHFIVLWGGRGSGKTHSAIEKILLDFEDEVRCNYLFAVYRSAALIGAFYPTIIAVKEKYNLDIKVTRSPLQVENKHGMLIFCSGFDNPEKTKNFTKIGLSLIDEATSMPYTIFKKIVDTTREIEDWKVYTLFNPIDLGNWVKQHLLDNPRYMDNGVSIHSTCEDNPFLPESKKEDYRRLTGDDYDINYLGKFGTDTSDLIFGGRLCKVNGIPDYAQFVAYGMDYSNGGKDPHAIVAVWLADMEIYIDEIYMGNCEVLSYENGQVIMDEDLIDLASILYFKCPELNKEQEDGMLGCCVADSATKITSDTLRALGLNIVDAEKGAGSVMNGIKFLNQFKRINITIHSKNAISQFYNFRWAKKDEEILEGQIDKKCKRHLIDATRYANERINVYG